MSILDELNVEQRKAAEKIEGPVLILAGAGSGKTRTVTYRIAHMIKEMGISPLNILALTFTNKAAKEMKEREVKLLGDQAESIWMSTFHALCVRILRRDGHLIGYDRDFSIADPSEQVTLVKRILRQLDLDPKQYLPRNILSQISNAKNRLQTPKQYEASAVGPFEKLSPTSTRNTRPAWKETRSWTLTT